VQVADGHRRYTPITLIKTGRAEGIPEGQFISEAQRLIMTRGLFLEIKTLPLLLARTSERSLVTSDPGASGKCSGIQLEIQ